MKAELRAAQLDDERQAHRGQNGQSMKDKVVMTAFENDRKRSARIAPLTVRDPSGWRDIDYARLGADVLLMLWRGRWLIATTTVAAIVAAAALALMLPKQYEAFGRFALQQEAPDPLKRDDVFEARFDDQVSIESEIKIFETRAVFEDVARRLALAEDPIFSPPPGALQSLVRGLRSWVSPPEPSADEAEPEGFDDAVKELMKVVDVAQGGQSRVIEVAVTTRDAELSATIANALIESHIARDVERRGRELAAAHAALQDRRDALRTELEERERRLNAFLREKSLLHDRDATSLAALLEQVEADVVNAEATARSARTAYAALERTQQSDGYAPAFAQSELVETLQSELAQREAALADVEQRVGPTHPDRLAAAAAASRVRDAIGDAKSAIVASAEVEMALAEARLADARQARDAVRARLENIAVNDVERLLLEQERDAALAIMQRVAERVDTLRERLEVLRPTVEFVGRAAAPFEASSPSRTLIVVGGAVGGFFGACALALLVQLVRGRVYRAEDVEAVAGAPILVAPSSRGAAPHDLIVENDFAAFSRAVKDYTYAFAARRARNDGERGEVVVITAPQRREGKTSLTLAIGRSLARLGLKTLVVEGDPASPELAQRAGCDDADGLDRFFAEKATGAEAVTRDKHGLIDVIGAKDAVAIAGPGAATRWRALRDWAAETYDVVLIDAPGLQTRPESALLVGLADACAVVARRGRTRKADLRDAMRKLSSLEVETVGVMING